MDATSTGAPVSPLNAPDALRREGSRGRDRAGPALLVGWASEVLEDDDRSGPLFPTV